MVSTYVSVRVVDGAPSISYGQPPIKFTFYVLQQITQTIKPTVTTPTIPVTSYSIDKNVTLPEGMYFDPYTGLIGGTPIEPHLTTTYNVHGWNGMGGGNSNSQQITIT